MAGISIALRKSKDEMNEEITKLKSEGFVEVVVGAICFYVGARARNWAIQALQDAKFIEDTPVVNIKNVNESYMGQYVKVYGEVTTKNVLHSRFTSTPCVYFCSVVNEVFEEMSKIKNSSSSTDSSARTSSSNASSSSSTNRSEVEKEQWTQRTVERERTEEESEMLLKDRNSDAEIIVWRPRESSYFTLKQTHDQFIKEMNFQAGSKRVLGTKLIEHVIPLKGLLNVYGEIGVTENDGQLCIKKNRSKPWIVTTLTKDEIVHDQHKSAEKYFSVSTIFNLIGLGVAARAGYCLYQAYKQ